jgi:hypothetical protein
MTETKGRKISQDRGGYCWCLIPQWYECMLMHIGIPSWCSIRCLFIRVRLWVVAVATLPWLELAWYIWVTNRWYEYGVKFRWTQHCSPWKQELTPSCDLEVYMKQFICIWIPTKRAGRWTHMVYLNCCNHLWVLILELNNCMKTNEKILTCLQAIEIHSDVTPSYAMMRSDRRGLWWICYEFKPLPAYTTMVVSLWFSFKDLSQVFPMELREIILS